MFERDPVAFLSYVRSDDAHEFGRITELRRTLEGEVRMQTGKAFHIFQDRNDIAWGEQWKERIESALRGVTLNSDSNSKLFSKPLMSERI